MRDQYIIQYAGHEQTNWLQSLNELLGSLVVLEVLQHKHDEVFLFHLAKIFDHEALDQRF